MRGVALIRKGGRIEPEMGRFHIGRSLARALRRPKGMEPPSGVVTGQIIECAIEVPRALGPGLREKTYDEALAIEMLERRMVFERQVRIPVRLSWK